MIKNLLFDLGDVIINIDVPRAAVNFAKLTEKTTAEVSQIFQEKQLFRQFETGIINAKQFRNYIREILQASDLSDVVIDLAWNSLLLELPPARVALLQTLANKYRLFLLSNTSPIHIAETNQILERATDVSRLEELFEIAFYSYEMNLMKPDPAIYLRVLEEAGILAEETLFLDDNADNIKSAQLLGIHTIHVQKPNTILEYLAEY